MPRAEPAKPGLTASGRTDAAMARTHTAEALATLVTIMGNADAPATARVSAANAVLDRAWGKPRQDFELSGTLDPVAAIQRARQRVHGHAKRACDTGANAGTCDASIGHGPE